MTAHTRKLLLAFALLGLGASLASTVVHYTLLTDPTYTSFCDVSATVSCTQAYLSRYGSLLGAPVAILGVLFFAPVALLTAFAASPRVVPAGKKVRAAEAEGIAGEHVTAYVFGLSLIGLAFTGYLAWASFFQLGAVCILCALTYVAVLGLALFSYRGLTVSLSSLPQIAGKDAGLALKRPAALLLAAALIGSGLLAIATFPVDSATHAAATQTEHQPLTDLQRAQFEKWYDLQPVDNLPIDKGTAKVLVVKFNDYLCPPCRRTYYEFKGILDKHTATGDVKYVLKHFPLEMECNTKNAGHLAACEAAAAVIMANRKGTGEKLEAWLFANQGPPQLTPDQVRRAVATVGGVTDFDAQYPAALAEVKADVRLGDQLHVESTPTFLINGRRIGGAMPPAAFEAAIELELKRAKAGS
jgi:protein-disulfide isomerase